MLTEVSWTVLIVAAILMALAPFGQTPHLVEKLGMLFNGTLRKPIDIFDLFLHLSPLVLIGIKAWKEFGN